MPHYFLHVVSGEERTEDPDGAEFADLAAAKLEALESARELISQSVLAGLPLGLARRFEIEDADGRALACVPFAEAIPRG
jgi:hypothetical protein